MLSVLLPLKVISGCCSAVKNCTFTHSSVTDQLGYITILSTVDDRYHLNGLLLDIRLSLTVEC